VVSAQYETGYQSTNNGGYRPTGYRPSGYKPTPYKPVAYKPASYDTGYKADNEGPSDYSFNYEVNDAQTYDVKSQSEQSKNGYGLRRTVDYTADDYNGFQATVRREPVGSYGQSNNGYPRYQANSAPSYQPASYSAPSYRPAAYSTGAPALSKPYGTGAYRPASYQASYPASNPASYQASYSASTPASYQTSYPASTPAAYPTKYWTWIVKTYKSVVS
jgi:hypothetical protein